MPTIDALRTTVTDLLGDGSPTPADHDDLIELGLDSIRIMRIADRLRREGVTVSFADLARRPTLAEWERLADATPGAAPAPAPTAATPAPADGEPFALAPMQHAYWVGRDDDQPLGGVGAHLYTEFDGHGVDPARLAAAVARLAARHDMLRARVLGDGRQIIDPPCHDVELAVADLRDATPGEVQARTAALRDELSHQLLDLAGGQVFDVRLSLLPGGRTRMHLDVDFLAADARSYRILLAELAHLYERPDVPLPALGYGYARYLADRAAQPTREEDVRWWRERVGELPGAPQLPSRAEHDQTDPHRVARLHRRLDPGLRARLTDAARRRGVTPAVAVATAFAEVIGAYSATPRFLLNVPMFDRRPLHPDVDAIVGDFTSSVLLDVDVGTTMAFGERARELQRRLHEGVAHGSYSGLDVLRDLSREAGAPVLAPVVFTSALAVGELFGPAVERCFGEPAWIVSQGPQVLLDAQVSELHGGLLVNWDVRTGAFPDGVPEAMFGAFAAVLDGLADDGGWSEPVAGLVPDAARRVRAAVNATDGPLPQRPLHAGAFEHAARRPEAVAVLGGASALTYGELADGALRVAACLRDRGIRAGDAVAIRLPRGPEQVVAVLGVLAGGAHYVPIDPAQPDRRVQRILRRAGVRHVLDAAAYAQAVAHHRPLAAPVQTGVDATAYVIFTSGSTGEPKGVEITHAQAANTIEDLVARYAIDGADRTLALSALDFDLSVFDIFAPLMAGGAIVTVDEAAGRDAAAWIELVREHDVSILDCVPALLDMLLSAGEQAALPASLRLVLTGGDWVGTDLPGRLHAALPACRFVALGGATEASIYSNRFEVEGAAPAGWVSIPYGTPLRNQRFRIVDAQGRDCPDWVAGELWIGGAGVAVGYRGEPERTAARFVEHDGVRWYRTGDRARYRADGVVEFLGRGDDQVKLRGYRIELGEVEATLAEHPDVRAAVALVDRSGPAARLCAAVVGSHDVDTAAVRAFAAQRLPAYMVPEHVLALEALPLTANGKVDRRALGALAATGRGATGRVAPRTPLEEAIAHVWSEALAGVAVGADDDYFLLGGDSVLATVIVGRLRDGLGTDAISVRDVLTGHTVAGLAARLRRGDGAGPRLEQAAELFLEVERMTDEELEAHLPAGELSEVPR
jgi:mycobactin phenyloxazoline synthetase